MVLPICMLATVFDPSWITVASGLGGAVIGALASFGGAMFVQRSGDARRHADESRRSAQVKALFIARSETVASFLQFQSMSKITSTASVLADALEPLERIAADPALVLELEPTAILLLLRGIGKARADVAVFESIMSRLPKDSDDRTATPEEKNRGVRAILQESATIFRSLMAELGVTDIPAFTLMVAYPEDY